MYLLLLCVVLVAVFALWYPQSMTRGTRGIDLASFHPRKGKFFVIVITIFLLLAAFLIFNPDVGHFLRTAEVVSA